jgi:AraC family transcriptional regulator
VTLPAVDSLRVVVQLSARGLHLERGMGGITRVGQPGLDAININPAYQQIRWQWDYFMEILQIMLPRSTVARIASDRGLDTERLLRLEKLSLHDATIAQMGHELAGILEGRLARVDTDYLDALATFLLLHLAQRYCRDDGSAGTVERQRTPDFSRIVEFIHGNLDKDLRVEQIARMANLSNFYFIRLFKAEFGKTPHQYILECRIGLAKELLAGSFLPISEISLRCGFSTQSHFTSAFRHSTGMSPRTFRQGNCKLESRRH